MLNEALLAEAEEAGSEVFCTAAYAGSTRRKDGGLLVEVCCGGHPPHRSYGPTGVEHLGRPGTALGLFKNPEFSGGRPHDDIAVVVVRNL